METTRTIEWNTKDGKSIRIEASMSCDVRDKVAYADGYNIVTGKETVDILQIKVYVDGKFFADTNNAPRPISPLLNGNYATLSAKGVYARLGDIYITRERYDQIASALAEMSAELTPTAEYVVVKAAETARQQAQDLAEDNAAREYAARRQHPGWCDKCQSYCYGDCEAN